MEIFEEKKSENKTNSDNHEKDENEIVKYVMKKKKKVSQLLQYYLGKRRETLHANPNRHEDTEVVFTMFRAVS